MLGRPAVPGGEAAVLLHQHAEQGVVGQPVGVLHQERAELQRALGFAVEMPLEEALEGGFEQLALERLDAGIIDRPAAQFGQQLRAGQLLEFRRRQIGNVARRYGDGGRLDGQRAEGVVGAVVVADLVDGQGLEDVQPVAVAPVNHLAHALGVADAEVVFGANGKDRLQNAGQRLSGTQFHN